MRISVVVLLSLSLFACSGTSDLGGDLFGDGGAAPKGPKSDTGFFVSPDSGAGTGIGIGVDPTRKRVFVTATAFNGDLRTAGGAATGLAGGDNLCNASAMSAGL